MPKTKLNVFWFRRDLRLRDNAGLFHALKDELPVLPLFIFDRMILDKLEDKDDKRVEFIHSAIRDIRTRLDHIGSAIEVQYGFWEEIFPALLDRYQVGKIFANEDYEPYAIERDAAVENLAKKAGTLLLRSKDQVIFAKDEIMREDGGPYSVFTPYSRKWKAKLSDTQLRPYPTERYFSNFYRQERRPLPTLKDMGFEANHTVLPSPRIDQATLRDYQKTRDYPAKKGTSKLGIHLRFGTVSIRNLVGQAKASSETFLNELIWREFYQMILWNFPLVGHGKSFKEEYNWIEWRNDETEFERWCTGRTGYPLVDAGMRELNATGFMHNRVRMVTASFLCKHLLIDWRWGEAYFARKLLDFDLASNNGGWQWVAGCGCDAAPYFRIFNPSLQAEKFDPDLEYIRKWVPESKDPDYIAPIVEHDYARKRCLAAYRKAVEATP